MLVSDAVQCVFKRSFLRRFAQRNVNVIFSKHALPIGPSLELRPNRNLVFPSDHSLRSRDNFLRYAVNLRF
jgi:hypothetical protein